MVDGRAELPGRRWVGLVQLAVVAAVVLAALYFMRAPTVAEFDYVVAEGGDYAPQVAVAVPVAGTQTASVALTGVVGLEGGVDLRAELPGRVVSVSPKLRPGASFGADETLVTLDPTERELAVRRAAGLLRAQQARMRKHELVGERDSAAFLRENPGRPVPALISREAQIARFKASADAAQAVLDQARLNLARTRFSLPFEGRVVATSVAVGDLVGSAVPFGRVYARTAVNVTASIAEDELGNLTPVAGRTVEVRTGGRAFPARVARMSAVVSPQSRMATLYVAFDDSVPMADMPLPGMFAEMTISGSTFDNAYLLPDAARQVDGGVWIVDGGVLRRFSPSPLGSNATGWIVSVFDAGDGVVLGPVPGASDGLAVKIAGSDGS